MRPTQTSQQPLLFNSGEPGQAVRDLRISIMQLQANKTLPIKLARSTDRELVNWATSQLLPLIEQARAEVGPPVLHQQIDPPAPEQADQEHTDLEQPAPEQPAPSPEPQEPI